MMKLATFFLASFFSVLISFNLIAFETEWEGNWSDELHHEDNWNSWMAAGYQGQFSATANCRNPKLTIYDMIPLSFTFRDSTSFTFSISEGRTLKFEGLGIVNQNGGAQNFNLTNGKLAFAYSSTSDNAVVNADRFSTLTYIDNSTAGTTVATFDHSLKNSFRGNSSADHAKITLNSSDLAFVDSAKGGNANIINNNGTVTTYHNSTLENATVQTENGYVFANDTSTAGNANIIANKSLVLFDDKASADLANINATKASSVEFHGSSSAGKANVALNDSESHFNGNSSAANSTITALNSSINFEGNSSAGNATILADKSTVTNFKHSSSTGSATIVSDDSQIWFNDNSNAHEVTIVSKNNTALIVDRSIDAEDLKIGTYSDDETCHIYLTDGKNLVMGTNGIDQTVNGKILGESAGGGLIKNGSGTLTLTNDNSYNRGTTINDGRLVLTGEAALPAEGSVTLNGSGILDMSTTPESIIKINNLSAAPGTFINIGNKGLIVNSTETTAVEGTITGNGSLTKMGPGTLIVRGQNTYLVKTDILEGVLEGTTTSLQKDIYNNSIASFNQSFDGTYNGIISGPGSLEKNGSGVLTLTGNNSYTGGTRIYQGVVEGNTTSLQGNIITDGVARFKQASDGTFNDSISGTGSLEKTEAGKLVLTGKNTYAGGTFVNNGILEGDTKSLQGDISVGDTLNFTQAFDSNFEGTVSGSGAINKNGSGKLNLTKDNAFFTGTTRINQGRLAINNRHGGDVIAEINSILSGAGTINGNLNVNGIVSPGNSIGTLTVKGNYRQSSGSTYEVQINSLGEFSAINVEGMANLDSGSRLSVISLDGQVTPSAYTILHADGGLVGQYTTVTSNNALFSPKVTYDGNNVYLKFVDARHIFVKNAITANQLEIAAQLDGISDPNAEELILLDALAGLMVDDIRSALDQISAHQYTNLLMNAQLANQRFIRQLYEPLREIISREPNCCCACDCNGCCIGTEGPLEAWFEASGENTHVKGNKNSFGFRSRGYELSLGAQTTLNDFWTLGSAISYAHEFLHYSHSAHAKANDYFGALYGVYRPCDFYLLSDITLGYRTEHLTRHIHFDDLKFKPHGRAKIFQSDLYVEGGKDFNLCSLLLQPFVGVEIGYFRHGHFRESHADILNMNIAKRGCYIGNSRLGVHLTARNDCNYTVGVDLAWQYRFTRLHNRIHERFNAFGSCFPIKGLHLERNSFDGAINLTAQVGCGWEIYTTLAGQWWERAHSYQFLGGVQTCW